MMRVYQLARSAHTRADLDTVTRLLDDVDTWAQWARPVVLRARWDSWGEPCLGGPAAVRALRTWPVRFREQIITSDAARQTYTMLDPPVFAFHHGAIEKQVTESGGTDIDWFVHFVPRLRLTGPLLYHLLDRVVGALLTLLARAADDLTPRVLTGHHPPSRYSRMKGQSR